METTHGKAEIDFNVMVCGTAQWPLTPPSTPFTIPDDVSIVVMVFIFDSTHDDITFFFPLLFN